jgi:antitoxin component YwqK of YwqJK toxin-antitoxin module
MLNLKAIFIVFLILALPIASYGQELSGGKEIRKEYYPDGKLKLLCEHNKEGLRDGTCKTFDKDGVVFMVNTYASNIQTSRKYLYPNGSVERLFTYRDGKLNGPSKQYYDNGKLKFELTYKDGLAAGPARGFHENGMLKSELTYKNGKAIGPFKQYYETGQLKFETTYWDGQAIGTWKEYDEKGGLK